MSETILCYSFRIGAATAVAKAGLASGIITVRSVDIINDNQCKPIAIYL